MSANFSAFFEFPTRAGAGAPQEVIVFPLADLTNDASELVEILREECPPLGIWRRLALEFCRRGLSSAAQTVLENACESQSFKKYVFNRHDPASYQYSSTSSDPETTHIFSDTRNEHVLSLVSLGASLLASASSTHDPAEKTRLLQKATKTFEQAESTDPNHIISRIAQGVGLLIGENIAQAADKFLPILEESPSNIPAMLGMAAVLFWRRHFVEALELFRRALILLPPPPSTEELLQAQLARRASGAGSNPDVASEEDLAADVARMSAFLHAPLNGARLGIGLCQFALGRLDIARAAFRRVLATDPGHVEAMACLGLLDLHTNTADSVQQGIARLAELFRRQPHHVVPLTQLAMSHLYRGDVDTAERLALHAYHGAAAAPARASAALALARVTHHRELNSPAPLQSITFKALEYYTEAARLDPTLAEAHFGQAQLRMLSAEVSLARGETNASAVSLSHQLRALQSASEALRLAPGDLDTIRLLGVLHARVSVALLTVNRAVLPSLTIQPSSSPSEYRLAAQRLLGESLQQRPQDAAALAEWAALQQAHGRLLSARAGLVRVAQIWALTVGADGQLPHTCALASSGPGGVPDVASLSESECLAMLQCEAGAVEPISAEALEQALKGMGLTAREAVLLPAELLTNIAVLDHQRLCDVVLAGSGSSGISVPGLADPVAVVAADPAACRALYAACLARFRLLASSDGQAAGRAQLAASHRAPTFAPGCALPPVCSTFSVGADLSPCPNPRAAWQPSEVSLRARRLMRTLVYNLARFDEDVLGDVARAEAALEALAAGPLAGATGAGATRSPGLAPDVQQAFAALGAELQQDGAYIDAHLRLALMALRRQSPRPHDAIRRLRVVLNIERSHPIAFALLAQAYQINLSQALQGLANSGPSGASTRTVDEPLQQLTRALEEIMRKQPDDPFALVMFGLTYHKLSKFPFKQPTEAPGAGGAGGSGPASAPAPGTLAEIQAQAAGRGVTPTQVVQARALDYFNRALGCDPQNVYAALGIAVVLAEKGYLAQARDILIKIFEVNKRIPEVYINLAHLYVEFQQYEHAVGLYGRALSHFHGVTGRKLLNEADARPEFLARHFAPAISHLPSHSPVLSISRQFALLSYIARAHFLQGKEASRTDALENAEKFLSLALRLRPWDQATRFNLALTQRIHANCVLDHPIEERTVQDIERARVRIQSACATFTAIAAAVGHSRNRQELGMASEHAKYCSGTLMKKVESSMESQLESERDMAKMKRELVAAEEHARQSAAAAASAAAAKAAAEEAARQETRAMMQTAVKSLGLADLYNPQSSRGDGKDAGGSDDEGGTGGRGGGRRRKRRTASPAGRKRARGDKSGRRGDKSSSSAEQDDAFLASSSDSEDEDFLGGGLSSADSDVDSEESDSGSRSRRGGSSRGRGSSRRGGSRRGRADSSDEDIDLDGDLDDSEDGRDYRSGSGRRGAKAGGRRRAASPDGESSSRRTSRGRRSGGRLSALTDSLSDFDEDTGDSAFDLSPGAGTPPGSDGEPSGRRRSSRVARGAADRSSGRSSRSSRGSSRRSQILDEAVNYSIGHSDEFDDVDGADDRLGVNASSIAREVAEARSLNYDLSDVEED
ncbi:hypothetical protein H696_05748 [Fonticula alba]|uniref:RNA polymerase-associated protein CTR9 n=1 Tax=Fonticula alba TaxID=691883 RepID=A0A058Z0Z2_FONAL|nr:hypothetical protein H696_05748 [Fonticula alba]KCV67806.1 hypothetical protein H696_05748 [Fonticula alba]|eukprot:XP_009497837.1 hypothetical protein H696_05748 [Fonticula alba]